MHAPDLLLTPSHQKPNGTATLNHQLEKWLWHLDCFLYQFFVSVAVFAVVACFIYCRESAQRSQVAMTNMTFSGTAMAVTMSGSIPQTASVAAVVR
jgi:hypothetical protein